MERRLPPAVDAPEIAREPPVSLDAVSAHWRVVFGAARDALRAASACGASLGFDRQELQERSGRLAREREATIRAQRLRSKPARDALVTACRQLGVQPHDAAAFETTVAGITAARAAGFGLVIGVDRAGRADTLRKHGADLVVTDLATAPRPVAPGKEDTSATETERSRRPPRPPFGATRR